ncbi:MAG: hypothetical protein KGI50_07415 [Patescibacteria group bacterium]|nr:hypothetical protein [Patescibacteria group bacterium]MDE2438785.1 hypothetical protein [Patescibacteria group bacterium]
MPTLSLREELIREIERQEQEESIARRERMKEREATYAKLRTQGLANLETILRHLTASLKVHARERTYQCVYPDTIQEYAVHKEIIEHFEHEGIVVHKEFENRKIGLGDYHGVVLTFNWHDLDLTSKHL